jgi:hypothetical protein
MGRAPLAASHGGLRQKIKREKKRLKKKKDGETFHFPLKLRP